MDLQPPDLRVQGPAGPTVAQNFAQGYDTGSAITGVQNAAQDRTFGLQQRDMQLQQQKIALQQAQDQQRDVLALVNTKDPTARDYSNLILKHPQVATQYAKGWDVLDKQQQQAQIDQTAPIFAAARAGNQTLALKLMDDHIAAMKNGGSTDAALAPAIAWRNVMEADPKFATHNMGLMLASRLGPERMTQMFTAAGTEQRADDAAPAAIAATAAGARKTNLEANEVAANAEASRANIYSEIENRGGKLALDTQKLNNETRTKIMEIEQKGGELPESARSIINASSSQATISRNTANQARSLAKQFDDTAVSAGLYGSTKEKLKQLTGSENYVSQLKNEYNKIRATAVRAGIPQGPASDKDVAFASKGFLSDNADPKQIASFLRGMATMQDFNAKYENIRAEWAGAARHLGKLPKDTEIDGVMVPAGTILDDFVKSRLETPLPVTPAAPGASTNYMDRYKNYNGTPQAPQG